MSPPPPSDGIIAARLVTPPPGAEETTVSLFGFMCTCLSVNQPEGTALFELDGLDRWRFTLPVFGPVHSRVADVGLRVGSKYWLALSGQAPKTKRKGKKR